MSTPRTVLITGGNRSIGLALDTPGGLEVLYEIVRGCDVFVTNFLPDARERLRATLAPLTTLATPSPVGAARAARSRR